MMIEELGSDQNNVMLENEDKAITRKQITPNNKK